MISAQRSTNESGKESPLLRIEESGAILPQTASAGSTADPLSRMHDLPPFVPTGGRGAVFQLPGRQPRMRHLTRAEVRDLDRQAIEEFGLPGIVLMENAGRGATEKLLSACVSGRVVV